MAYTPKVGIVTVLFHSEGMLPELFASLDAQTYRGFTLYGVDNASLDRSVAMARSHGAICIENEENRGVAAANNQGIAAALADGCDAVLLLNNDVRFGPELLQQLVSGLEEHQCDMTTPLMLLHDRPETIWCAGGGFQSLLGERPVHYGEGEHDLTQFPARAVAFSPTCCVLIRREVFARIGVMDEHYFVYFDDTDFMLRAHRAGLSLWFLPQAKLWHKVGGLTRHQGDFTLRYATRNHAYYLRKHLPTPLAAWWLAVYGIAFVLLAPFSVRYRIKLRSWIEGMRMPIGSER